MQSTMQQQRAEKNIVLQAQNKVRTKRSFNEEDKVVVFDLKTKTSTAGVVTEVCGNNDYLVEVDGIVKHVFGDCITVDKSSKQENNSINVEADNNNELLDLSQDVPENILEDDTVSLASESLVASIIVGQPPHFNNNRNVNNCRGGRRMMMVRRLGSPPRQQSRLRSGH